MKLADISGKRQNAAMGAVDPAQHLAEQEAVKPPKRNLPSDLDPRVFDHRVGLDDDDEGDMVLQRARSAFSQYSKRLEDWQKREAVVYSDKFETPAKKRMVTSQMVSKEMTSGLEAPDQAHREATQAINAIDREMDKAFRSRLKSDEAREVRQHLKSLNKKQRRELLQTGDADVVAAALGAKPFLSGLTDAEAELLRHQTVQTWFPSEVKRREKLSKAVEQIESANNRYLAYAANFLDPEQKDFEAVKSKVDAAVKGEL